MNGYLTFFFLYIEKIYISAMTTISTIKYIRGVMLKERQSMIFTNQSLILFDSHAIMRHQMKF